MTSRSQANKPGKVCNLFEKKYGDVEPPEQADTTEQMMMAVLLDHVSKGRAQRVLQKIKTRFVDWNEVRVSIGREIAVQAGDKGVSQVVARCMSSVLKKLYDDRSVLDLDFLDNRSHKDVAKYLCDVLGLTPKQAAWVLLYGMGRPAIFPTPSLLRVARRIGLVGENWDVERSQKSLERTIPRSKAHGFCAWMNTHANRICLETSPRCSRCAVLSLCDYGRKKVKKKRKTSKRKTRRK